jgi:hypothetical protein
MQYFNLQIEYCLNAINLNRLYAKRLYTHYDLACVYSFLEEKEKAFQYLLEFAGKDNYPSWLVAYIKYDPLLDNIRADARFESILNQAIHKYQKEHNRLKDWMEEEGIM